MIAESWVAELADGRRVVVKRTADYDATVEADGLEALAAAGAPVPEVLSVSEDLLVMSYVEGRPDWPELGRTIAAVHRETGSSFGWRRDNVIGPLPQDNTLTSDWPSFYADRRVRPWLEAEALPPEIRRRLEQALDGPLQQTLEHDPVPSLIHGDLWSGNVVDGCWLVDPAVYHADREVELAYMDLFGGFPGRLWRAYEEAWPLDEGWEVRRPALQLYNLLVHVELFGATYVRPLALRLDRLGW